MKNKSALQSILIGLFVVLVLAASNSTVRAQVIPPATTWTNSGTGDWFTPGNWSGNTVPNALVDASINNGGQAQILGGNASAQSLGLGENLQESGALQVDGVSAVLDLGTPTCRGDIYIGNQGKGSLAIGNGGKVTNRSAYVAASTGSSGDVTLVGFGTQWRLEGAGNGCPGAGLFIGCTDTSDAGGNALVDVQGLASITVASSANAPGVKVGLSGTLTGNGVILLPGTTLLAQTAVVSGTLAPAAPATGPLTIAGNLDLRLAATTVFNLTPQTFPTIAQLAVTRNAGHSDGGVATLSGRVSVTMSGDYSLAPTRFTLLHADVGLSQTFFSSQSIKYPTGQGWTPRITYDYAGGNVYLDRVYDLAP